VRLLPDTHAVLWGIAGDRRLSPGAREQFADPANEILLSSVVIWEVEVKRSLGKLEAPDDVADLSLGAGALELPVTIEHARAAGALPWHHRDPFDRMLVAQAQIEGAVLVSSDEALRAYAVPVYW
jgi:PIN domain nuclease of toxin-antitoxin system